VRLLRQVEALYDIDLTVHSGQVVTVIGANGAGKTTLLAAIMAPCRGCQRGCLSSRRREPPDLRRRSWARASIAERVALD